MLASISSVAGMSLVGSIFGTVAWYQYSTRATASIMGSDAAVSENLQITLGNGTTDANWKADLTRNDIYNYMKDTAGTDMAFAVKPCTNVGAEKMTMVAINSCLIRMEPLERSILIRFISMLIILSGIRPLPIIFSLI